MPRISSETNEDLGQYSPLSNQLLHNRGVRTVTEREQFLSKGQDLLEDTSLLPNITSAIKRIKLALEQKESISVFGDFDADGTTGTALLAEGLETLGANVIPYIPHRVKEGHGLSESAIKFLNEQGVSLIITVDCGITSSKEISIANSLGIDTIVTDHHPVVDIIPDALAIINPHLSGSKYPFTGLAGVGLAFKLVQALFEDMNIPWDKRLLQMAALGTITDVTPLIKENRYIVSEGIKSMNEDPITGLKELLRMGGEYQYTVDSESISFFIGPRINAAGRLDDPMLSYRLLRAQSTSEASDLAKKLDALNLERRDLTKNAMDIAEQKITSSHLEKHILILSDEAFTPGIAGLVASRVVDSHHKPTIVISLDGQTGRASARSTLGFDISSAIEECADLLISGGGHPRAAGFTIKKENILALESRLFAIAERDVDKSLSPSLNIDAYIKFEALNTSNLQFLTELEPYGEGNPKPLFISKNVLVLDWATVGSQGQHIRFTFKQGNETWNGIAFNQGSKLTEEDLRNNAAIDIVYSVGTNKWRGKTETRLVVEDFKVS